MLMPTGATAADWKTRVFTASYDGKGSFSYTARGSSTDTGCYMDVNGGSNYGFDQLWRVKVAFKRLADGSYDSKVDSIVHVDGPQALGHYGGSHLKGTQYKHEGDCYDARVGGPNTGTFDCLSGAPTLTPFNNPQMEISRHGDDLVVIGKTFFTAGLDYSGTDTIPSDKKFDGGCAHYNDDWAFGSTVLPGTYSAAKVSLPVKKLDHMAKGSGLAEDVGLGKNTEFPTQQTCATTFGAPRLCIINKQSLSGTFRWGRSK